MITNLNEINRILLALRRLCKRRNSIPRHILIDYLNGSVIMGQNPEFDPILNFTHHLGIITIRRIGIAVAPLGDELLTNNSNEFYELQPEQRTLLVRRCYLDGPLRSEMKRLVKLLHPHPSTGRMTWSSVDSEPFGEIEWLSRHLLQLGVLSSSGHLLSVTDFYRETISQFLDEGGDFTEEQMEKSLREKRLLAELAEEFVLEFEKSRLIGAGYRLESACVQRISKHRVSAGYDINSFDASSSPLKHDRFIEVKGSGKATVFFYWTQNEVKMAEKLGQKYWIYFVGGIDRKNRLVTREPVMIQNPQVHLKSDARFKIEAFTRLVEGNVCGNLLVRQWIRSRKRR